MIKLIIKLKAISKILITKYKYCQLAKTNNTNKYTKKSKISIFHYIFCSVFLKIKEHFFVI